METKGKECQHCGKSLVGLSREGRRKYCSKTCGWRAQYRKQYPNRPHKLWQHEVEVFENAMELYWSGLGGAEISQRFNVPDGTVYSWIHDFGGQRERAEPKKSQKERFRTAESADEWLEALRENTGQGNVTFEDLSVTLVCKKLRGQSVDTLATVVYESLKDNPMNGKEYAFCNKCGNSITTLAWKEPVFRISRYIKPCGTFIWPHEHFGKALEITRADFDRLIHLRKQNKILPKPLKTLAFTDDLCYA